MKSDLKIAVILIGIVVAVLCTYYTTLKNGFLQQSPQTGFLIKVENRAGFK